MSFNTAAGYVVGFVTLSFDSSPKYYISYCTSTYSPFPSTLPSDVNKTWKITKFAGPRITVHCNEVEVLNILMSDETCTYSNSGIAGRQWSKKVEQISFQSWDTASDYFRSAPGKYYLRTPDYNAHKHNIEIIIEIWRNDRLSAAQ